MEYNERNIPLPIQRQIRQRCGFGCVVCGFPLYEYHHLKGWANVHEHIAEDITILCDQHHREVTSGLMSMEQVIKANQSPYNLSTGHSKMLPLHFEGDSCEMHIGGNSFTTIASGEFTPSIPIMIDGIPIIAFILQDHQLLLNLNIFDQFNNKIMAINNNQLIYSVSSWDIEFVGQTLTIRERAESSY